MPTYEYLCTECGHNLEVVQSFSDDALTECPQCHGRLRKVFGNVGVTFKGSGFYKTDSRSSKKSASSAPAASDSGSTSTSSDSSAASSASDAKPSSSDSSSSTTSAAKPSTSSSSD